MAVPSQRMKAPGRTVDPTAWAQQRRARIEAAAAVRRQQEDELTEHHTFQPHLVTRDGLKAPAPLAQAPTPSSSSRSARSPRLSGQVSQGGPSVGGNSVGRPTHAWPGWKDVEGAEELSTSQKLTSHKTPVAASLKHRMQVILSKTEAQSTPTLSTRGSLPSVSSDGDDLELDEALLAAAAQASAQAQAHLAQVASNAVKGASCSFSDVISEDAAAVASRHDEVTEDVSARSVAPASSKNVQSETTSKNEAMQEETELECTYSSASEAMPRDVRDASSKFQFWNKCVGMGTSSDESSVQSRVQSVTPAAKETADEEAKLEYTFTSATGDIPRDVRSASLNFWRRYMVALPDESNFQSGVHSETQEEDADSECRIPFGSPRMRSRAIFPAEEQCNDEEGLSGNSAASPALETFTSQASEQALQRCSDSQVPRAQLLEAWKVKRSSEDAICTDEKQALTNVIFATMPQSRVKIVRLDRIYQPDLLAKFCEEEQQSLLRERDQQRRHKQFMFLHGTRWELVPTICSNGLDPDCGHLSKGIWLGQNAEAAHSYAAKGPGPELENGRRYFAMFAVACMPNHGEGDEERSFGVWRVLSGSRMYPAYLIVYSAPLDVRVRRPYPSPRMNKSVQVLMQLREDSVAEARSPSSSARMRGRSVEATMPPGTSTTPVRGSLSPNRGAQPTPRMSIAGPEDGSGRRVVSPRPSTFAGRRGCCNTEAQMPQRPSMSALIQQSRRDTSPLLRRGSVSTPGQATPPAAPPRPKPAAPAPTQVASPCSSWEVQLDDQWVPLLPGTKLNDQPGMKHEVVNGQFWYRLVFDSDGMTGRQINLSTGKTRPLRRRA
eukprot:TRINITY_DN36474_c0_g1_i1.p1 TRINITY_DN36474_c0_g1~~TRINITY_DN36474_c0_g1_i1.p1  ORF type:complete len:844 (+),score=127.66 TRINITY_DN36474_c0_g1_i1:27-2534(+)